jgi:hypothetical protein
MMGSGRAHCPRRLKVFVSLSIALPCILMAGSDELKAKVPRRRAGLCDGLRG